ncbi:hypothetical protein [Paraburkholderia tropica]|uniref:hypothetical protein n=1 Tax=Paraburkholderia tropica TaxID=92647 RepID=UPI002AB18DB1|nr:hypothetical protein [Paraburkholderia tropica]
MSIVEGIARALALRAHEAVDLILRHTGESVTEVETEVEKGFDEVDVGGETPDDEEDE